MIPGPTKWRAVAAVLTAVTVASAACANPVLTQGPRLAKDQVLRVAIDDQPQSLDPGQAQFPFENAILREITEPLLKPRPDMNGVTGATATGYDVGNNGTVYVFHLRKDAEYSDGQPVKAQDFVYAWRRLIDPRLASPEASFFASSILNGDKVSILDPQRDAASIDAGLQSLGLTATDDTTFQVTLSRPDPAFVWLAAMPAAAPVRQDVVAKYGDRWSLSPESMIGNGPFRLQRSVTGDHLTVVPNPHYWGPKPTLTSIDFIVVNDGAAALNQYQAGSIDVMRVQPPQAAKVAGDQLLRKDIVKSPALTVYWIAFRVTSARLSNSKVRVALAEAIDRNAFVNRVFLGQARAADTFIPEGMRGFSPELGATQKFDVAQARSALASAGVTAAQLSGIKFSYDKSNDFAKATAQFVHDQLKTNLAVDISLNPLDANTLGSQLDSGAFEMAGPLGWNADYPDPADWYPIFTTTNSNNYSLYQNSRYDSLVSVAAADDQQSRRDAEYSQAQKMLVEDAPAAFLAQSFSWYLVHDYVRGLTATSVDDWPGELFPNQLFINSH